VGRSDSRFIKLPLVYSRRVRAYFFFSPFFFLYVCVYMCVCVYIYIYICTHMLPGFEL